MLTLWLNGEGVAIVETSLCMDLDSAGTTTLRCLTNTILYLKKCKRFSKIIRGGKGRPWASFQEIQIFGVN
jgi:hypothetical protein